MSKLSQSFRRAQGPPPNRRLMVMGAAVVLLLGVLIALRVSMLPSGTEDTGKNTGEVTPPEPDGVKAFVLPAADNATAKSPPTAPTPADNVSASSPLKSDAELFGALVDGEPMHADERDAYYRLVTMAWELGKRKPTATPPIVNRLKLIGAPDKYRAKLVRIEGRLARVRPFKFDPDRTGSGRPRRYYECAIGRKQKELVMVLLFEDPQAKGIEVGRDNVRIDAYFFKVFAYRSDAGTQIAPLLMGRGLVEHNVAAPDYLSGAVTGLLIVLGFIIIGLWIWLGRGKGRADAVRRRIEREHADEVDIPEPHALPRDERRPSR